MPKKTEAQIRATRAWESRNKEKTKIDSYRRTARLFIRNYATKEDMEEFLAIFEGRNKVELGDKRVEDVDNKE